MIPNENTVSKLEERNSRLFDLLKDNVDKDKQILELKYAIDNNLVKKFWISCQG
jgi:hypothetical protein